LKLSTKTETTVLEDDEAGAMLDLEVQPLLRHPLYAENLHRDPSRYPDRLLDLDRDRSVEDRETESGAPDADQIVVLEVTPTQPDPG